jgi:hypothetical protein
MTWKTIATLTARKDDPPDLPAKQREIRALIQKFDTRVQATLSLSMPPEMADRLATLIVGVPGISKRDVVLTGIDVLLTACEKAPQETRSLLKIGAFDSRGRVSLTVKAPLDLDERLTKFVNQSPGVSRRDVAVSAIDLVLAECEKINGGPFPPIVSNET